MSAVVKGLREAKRCGGEQNLSAAAAAAAAGWAVAAGVVAHLDHIKLAKKRRDIVHRRSHRNQRPPRPRDAHSLQHCPHRPASNQPVYRNE